MSCQFHVKDGFKAPKNWGGHHGENPAEWNPNHDRKRAGKKVSLHAFSNSIVGRQIAESVTGTLQC
jgi:hypothetical protein